MSIRAAMIATALWVGLMGTALEARADVKPNTLLSEGAVLQQQTKVRVWGIADPGEKVTVSFRDQTAMADTDKEGRWSVQLDSKAAGGPFPMTIEGKNKIELKNVLVGEVWVCSGQSNMAMLVGKCNESDQDAARKSPANPELRMFTVAKTTAAEPATDVKGSWIEAKPGTVNDFSAVAYFFGRDLQAKRKVPVGLIHTSWGGTPVEAWTSQRALESVPVSKQMLTEYLESLKKGPEAKKDKPTSDKDKKDAKRPLSKNDSNPTSPRVLYNGMIAPLLPYTIKGAIWYQGEANALKAYDYRTLFPLMIRNWREDWNQGDFPFLFVQLAPYQYPFDVKKPGASAWAELCDAQKFTSQSVPNTGMAVITDYGHESDVHPTPKQPVGERLALIARAKAYSEDVEYSGPQFEGMKIEGSKVILRYTHVGSGLVSRELVSSEEKKNPKTGEVGHAWRVKPDSDGATLMGFALCGADHTFHPAKAVIDGDTVVLSCDQVPKPEAVRYGWASHPKCNLFNKKGLPAWPFRTDFQPMITQQKKN